PVRKAAQHWREHELRQAVGGEQQADLEGRRVEALGVERQQREDHPEADEVEQDGEEDGEPGSPSHRLAGSVHKRGSVAVLGSNVSRSPSASRLKARIVRARAAPGKVATHHPWRRTSCPSAIMFPQLGMGGWSPRPRNERDDSMRIMSAIRSAARMTAGV